MSEPIYLDNAATSHPKPETVYQAVNTALRLGGSPGRGDHRRRMDADRLVFETRELLAELFHAENSERFVLTPNATLAINLALFGILRSGDRVVTTSVEHNAVVRPLRALEDRGVTVVKVAADPISGIVDPQDLQRACLAQPTRLLLMTHCSNVIGSVQPIAEMGGWCRRNGILFMVDGSQSAGALPVDLQGMSIDLFAAPGHKGLLGPQGTGFLYAGDDIEMTPLIYGGTGSLSHSDRQPEELPDRLECGTFNLPGVAGLHAALQFLQETGIATIRRREEELVGRLVEGLAALDGIELYGPRTLAQRGAAVSFNLLDQDPAEVGFALDREAVSLRTGLHCAPDAHRTIGTYPRGTLRASPGYFTCEEEITRFIDILSQVATR